ncbi:MAG: SMC-Scp complex subunit ScpB [archaeon]
MPEKDFKNQIEALLFASGRFVNIETLLNLTGASGKQVLINNINRLKQEYDERQSPLMVVEEKDGWKLTVREPYLPLVRKIVSETELPKTILETLAVIAWKAPVLQSEIIDIRHNKAYEHIAELEELGFIRKDLKGRSYLLSLTEKFFEYFDIEGAKDIREVLAKVVGKADQSKVDDFKEQAAKTEAVQETKENLAAATEDVSDKSQKKKPAQEEESKEDDSMEFSELEEGKDKENREEFSEL